MSGIDHWLLPEGIEEMLPDTAWRMESLRRRLLDLYRGWGYGLIIPPMIEYLESLLTGAGHALDLQTFKLTDQLTGRLLGVRADMTPQAARIDAHALKRDEPVRLCYLGTVLHALPDGFAGSRSPLQVGCELFGHAGLDSDLEILALMLETLRVTGLQDVHLDLGHVGVFRALARAAQLTAEQEADLFDVLQRKAVPEIESLLVAFGTAEPWRGRLLRLCSLHGGAEVLAEARSVLAGTGDAVTRALDNLAAIAAQVQARWPDLPLHFDLAELRGYEYQTGVVFAAFVPGCGQEVARGGRYDKIGEVFGRARPATGFSADLRTLMALSKLVEAAPAAAIFAPAQDDAALRTTISDLRAKGERVICALSGQNGAARAMGCDRELVKQSAGWVVKQL